MWGSCLVIQGDYSNTCSFLHPRILTVNVIGHIFNKLQREQSYTTLSTIDIRERRNEQCILLEKIKFSHATRRSDITKDVQYERGKNTWEQRHRLSDRGGHKPKNY